jgi:hypothetical protein
MIGVRKLWGRPAVLAVGVLVAVLAAAWLSPAAGSTARSALAGPCTVGTWQNRAPMPQDAYGVAMTSDGTYAYAAGGYSFSAAGNVSNFRRFNPATNTWTPLAAVPDLSNAMASTVYSPLTNKIYMFGGENVGTAAVSKATRIYDIATNTWSTGADMPDVRAFMASGYYNGKIYLVGGYSTGSVTPAFSQVWIYNPATNSFTTGASMPATLGGAGFGVINGHLYVAGGRNDSVVVVNSLYDYDIVGNSWTQKANLPAATNVPGSGVVVLDGRLWIFGGGNPFGPVAGVSGGGSPSPFTTATSSVYTPGTNSWASGPGLNTGRSFVGGTAVGSTLVAAGGYTGSTTTTATETLSFTCGGTITVTKHVISNPSDTGLFNLRIDGTTYAANVGDGGTTGAVPVSTGSHTVSETAGTATLLGNYTARIACSDGSAGYGTSLSGIQVNLGDNVTCTITNTRKLFKP